MNVEKREQEIVKSEFYIDQVNRGKATPTWRHT